MKSSIEHQKTFFHNQHTQSLIFRKKVLKNLKHEILTHEQKVIDAINNDLGRPSFETFTAEIYQTLEEIKFMLKHLDSLAQIKRVKSPWLLFPSKSYVRQVPYGVVLIMAPWNFPFQLCMVPLVGAIAAGNCVIIKPSEYAPHTAKLIQMLITQACQPEHVTVIQGGVETAQNVLEQQFDYIFFTGSLRVGKIVMQKAAEHLTPLTLELGGKNPCIIDDTAHIPTAMTRIAWGKFLNAGQNCVAPDYLLVPDLLKHKYIDYLQKAIKQFYGDNPAVSNNYARIINPKHISRLKNLLATAPVIDGGQINEEKLYIGPTLIDTIDLNHPLMQEELFGPLLPIITYKHEQEVLDFVQSLPRPLACYIFSTNKNRQQFYIDRIQAGGIGINDVVLQAASVYLPFGGVGNSGFGNYHGEFSFKTFSRPQSCLYSYSRIDLPLRYPPYTQYTRFIQRLLRWLVR